MYRHIIYIYLFMNGWDGIAIKQEFSMNTEQYNTRYWNEPQLLHNFKFHALQSSG